MSVLSVSELSVTYATGLGPKRVLEPTSFAVEPGEALAIVGESGSGKSTLAMAIAGLLPQSAAISGRVEVGGRAISALNERELSDVRGDALAVIFQNPMTSMNPTKRIGKQIEEQIRRHRAISKAAAKKRALELLDEVQIRDPEAVARRYPHELSGGMRQRAMIAMAVSCEPQVLLADEPTTALDATVQAQILDILHRLRVEHSMALILVTHDIGVVAEVATNVAVMYEGRWVEYGSVAEVVDHPAHPYTAGLLAAAPELFDRAARTRRLPTITRPAPMLDVLPSGLAPVPSAGVDPAQQCVPGERNGRFVRIGEDLVPVVSKEGGAV